MKFDQYLIWSLNSTAVHNTFLFQSRKPDIYYLTLSDMINLSFIIITVGVLPIYKCIHGIIYISIPSQQNPQSNRLDLWQNGLPGN